MTQETNLREEWLQFYKNIYGSASPMGVYTILEFWETKLKSAQQEVIENVVKKVYSMERDIAKKDLGGQQACDEILSALQALKQTYD